MNKEEVFLKVQEHLLTQNKRSITELTCQYRTYNGLKCAIGCLIPPNLYSKDLEGKDVNHKLILDVLEKALGPLSAEDIHFLSELQRIHDGNIVEDWPRLLKNFASSQLLEIPNESV